LALAIARAVVQITSVRCLTAISCTERSSSVSRSRLHFSASGAITLGSLPLAYPLRSRHSCLGPVRLVSHGYFDSSRGEDEAKGQASDFGAYRTIL
jgi:hypothetical protein